MFRELFEKSLNSTEVNMEMWKEVKKRKKKPYKFYSNMEDSDIDEEFKMKLSDGNKVNVLLDNDNKTFYFEWK